jgi:hypothetical protein
LLPVLKPLVVEDAPDVHPGLRCFIGGFLSIGTGGQATRGTPSTLGVRGGA